MSIDDIDLGYARMLLRRELRKKIKEESDLRIIADYLSEYSYKYLPVTPLGALRTIILYLKEKERFEKTWRDDKFMINLYRRFAQNALDYVIRVSLESI